MSPSYDNICRSIKMCLCHPSPVWVLLVHQVHRSRWMLSSTSSEVSETSGCHDNTQGSNFSIDFLQRQNKYSIQSLHLLVKGIIYSFYVFQRLRGKTGKNQRVTNQFLPHLYLKLLKTGALVRFK